MLKILTGLVFFLITTGSIYAQDDFDCIYDKTTAKTTQQKLPGALKTADSLYRSSPDPLHKMKSLMLTAHLYQQQGDFKKAIYYAENADLLINKVNDPDLASRITEFLARQYRLVGLRERSKKYINKGFEIAKRIEDPKRHNETLGILNQELAHCEMELENYPIAVKYLGISLNFFKKAGTMGEEVVTAASYRLLGDVYFKQNNYTVSENYYKQAEALVKEQSCLLGWIYNGLGGIRLKQKLWKEAEFYLSKAEDIAEKYNHLDLKKGVYSNLNDYYEGIEDGDNASVYAVKYVKVYEQINAKNNAFTNGKLNAEIPNKGNGEINIAKNIAIVILCIALGGLFIFFRSKQKKQRSKFRTIIRSQQKLTEKENIETEEPEFSNISVEEVEDKEKEVGKKRTESLMTLETETKLLEFLTDFEKGNLYNNKNMSLPFLSGELNTNTKYLSYIINQHKSADFKTYINRLRINYIVDKLINDDKYRQYKISILAEECGFSSHSKFASVFKAVTDLSPSSYIKLLDAENQLDKNVHFQENN
ncbi:AraC family transcriptional regulator [Chryseobacterium sp. ERMR1:04]|uniref:AraC family transcriptional regulator n=1 Tax=Chryseobacterium sp. ERMR1:04 TaxID=1705393 RepID=UPI0006C83140|nr:AraC family transcriptional regulator [Chryseobacterium sp. ERMR1:04]KPH15195.1 hypothetical protein AMQ68_07330 [Chryseobacterium sp. ERMR1:04]